MRIIKRKCDACGKEHNKTILIDSEDDDEIYYCKKCHLELKNKTKNRINHTRKMFISEEKKLPKWLLDRGIMEYCHLTYTKNYIEENIKFLEKSANRKNRTKQGREMDLRSIKRAQKSLKEFKIDYFAAEDVEKFWNDILDKYNLVEKK